MSVAAAEFLKWLLVYNVPYGGGGDHSGPVTQQEVQRSAFNYSTATGADDAFVVTLSPAITELTNGLLISFTSDFSNLTSSPTLQVNSLSPVDISTFAGAPNPGDIQPGLAYLFIYNASSNQFQLLNPTTTTADSLGVQSNIYNYAW